MALHPSIHSSSHSVTFMELLPPQALFCLLGKHWWLSLAWSAWLLNRRCEFFAYYFIAAAVIHSENWAKCGQNYVEFGEIRFFLMKSRPFFFCPLFFERWCAKQNFSNLRCHLQTGLLTFRASQVKPVVKNWSANAGDTRHTGSIPGSGRSIPWRREQQPTLVFLPIESRGQRSLVGHSPQTCKELDTTKAT